MSKTKKNGILMYAFVGALSVYAMLFVNDRMLRTIVISIVCSLLGESAAGCVFAFVSYYITMKILLTKMYEKWFDERCRKVLK